jgi:predicted helicase
MRHFLAGENVGLMVCRQQKIEGFSHCLVHENVVESCYVSNRTSEIGSSFPVYLYLDDNGKLGREPNLQPRFVRHLLQNIGRYRWQDDHDHKTENDRSQVSPMDILDYSYAILYSPKYRLRYKDFLKQEFPRVPIARNSSEFWQLVKFGRELRSLHLMKPEAVKELITSFPVSGSDVVDRLNFTSGRVMINEVQYFDGVQQEVWDLQVGAYQPAQQWLKDRRGVRLDTEEVMHYQEIIVVLSRTIELMSRIDTALATEE